MICSEKNCKEKAEFLCVCSREYACPYHVSLHSKPGAHMLEAIYLGLDDATVEKIANFLTPVIKQLSSAMDACLKHSIQLISQIKANARMTVHSLNTQYLHFKNLLNKIKEKKIVKKDFNLIWNALNNCGVKDLLNLFRFGEEARINPLFNHLKKAIPEIVQLNGEVCQNIVTKYYDDSSFRETIQFLSELNLHHLALANENSNKVLEKIRLHNLNTALNTERNEPRLDYQSTADSLTNTFESSCSYSSDINFEDLSSFFTKEILVNILKTHTAIGIKNVLQENKPEKIGIESMAELVKKVEAVGYMTNKEILNIFIHRLNLVEKLKVVKQFFLLGQGDIFNSFFEKLKTSSKESDFQLMFKECLEAKKQFGISKTVMSDLSFQYDEDIQDIKISYRFVYPLNVFFTEQLVSDLQSIFLCVFSLKKVEYNIKTSFMEAKFISENDQDGLDFNKYFALRYTCTVLVNDLIYFILVEIIEKIWKKLWQKINSSINFEESVILFRETVANLKLFCGDSNKSGRCLRQLIKTLNEFSEFSEGVLRTINESRRAKSSFKKNIEKHATKIRVSLFSFISALESLPYEYISYFRSRLNEFSFLNIS